MQSDCTDIAAVDITEAGERILDIVSELHSVSMTNAAGIVFALHALRAVAADHGLSFDAAAKLTG